MSIDILELADLLRRAAQTEILPRFRHLEPGEVQQKTEAIDLVTEADTAGERMIHAEAAQRWPGALFVGEESVAADPPLLDRLNGAELAIVVDPVDGTANFAAGLPLFAVMAAVVEKGETVAGLIYDPMGDDWVLAERGGGAWLRRPDGTAQRLHVAEAPGFEDMVGHVSIAFLPPAHRQVILGNLGKIRVAANYRVAGHDYRTLATGHCHFLSFGKLMPWDHLAGCLIAEEAGGHVARYNGSPYKAEHRDGGLLVATDRDTWNLLRREIFTV